MKLKLITLLAFTLLSTNSLSAQVATTSISTSTEPTVKVFQYSRKLFERTEYSLVVKSKDFKNLQNDKLENEMSKLNSEQNNLVSNSLKNFKSNSVSNLLKITDPQILKIIGEKNVSAKYKEDVKYFKNYKIKNHNIGFVTTLADESKVILGDFKENSGESKMFGMILSKYKNKYYLNSVVAGETSLVVAFPPESNKDPIIIGNPVRGFSTKDLDKLDASVLVPDNWFYRYEENDGTQAYFISEQEIKKDTDIFETGFTMNVNYQYLVPGEDAVKYIDIHLDKIKTSGKIEKMSSGEANNYLYKQIIKSFTNDGVKYKMAIRVIANKKTNTLYIVMFETTAKKWDKEWNTKGKPMFDYLSISR